MRVKNYSPNEECYTPSNNARERKINLAANVMIMWVRSRNRIKQRHRFRESFQWDVILQPTEPVVSSRNVEFMEELKEVLKKNASDMEFGVDEMAKLLYMSRATLNRKIKRLTGKSTNQFIQHYRLKRAAQLLKTNFGNVTEVAFEVGFSSSGYFSQCFKEVFHQLPHNYMK
ncbi:MAG: helix-turn-helix transcriptional regulator [bacterium]|nr:helix-turn-helix transcriptional regulator [bacterium]